MKAPTLRYVTLLILTFSASALFAEEEDDLSPNPEQFINQPAGSYDQEVDSNAELDQDASNSDDEWDDEGEEMDDTWEATQEDNVR